MPNELVQYSVSDIRQIGETIAKSKLFGLTTPEQAIALCMVAYAEGRHPALAAKDYDIIQNKPAKKAEAMLRDFQAAGGKVEWHELTNDVAIATFSHPSGGAFKCDWNMKRASDACLTGKDNWKKYPRAMLRSRCVSEGVKTVYPAATSGMYTPEEVRDFSPPMQQWAETPPAITQQQDAVFIETWSKLIAKRIDDAVTEKEIDDMLASSKTELAELHEKRPEWFDRLSVKINQAKEAFQLMHAAE